VILAVLVASGALAARSVPAGGAGRAALVIVGAACVLAAATSRPLLLGGAAFLLAAVLGARSWAGIEAPPAAHWVGEATLVSDPAPGGGLVRAQLRLAGGRHVDALAFGAPGACLSSLLAGERIAAEGSLVPLSARSRTRLAALHISGRLTVSACRPVDAGPAWSRAANGLRRTLARGATVLPKDRQGLWAGLVVGDNRDEPAEIAADFSGAGLTHLLAVSGQNVAFALAAAGPLLRRLGLRGRLVGGVAVLGLFGTAVRWEPSVLRATAMAALALAAGALGVEASGLRMVALAVAGLVLVDPMLVHRLGFQLSVAAALGLALWARPLAARLPGPPMLRDTLAATLAAQAATAPLLLSLGGLPPASIPANALAVPAAGPIMVWGLTGGLAAGLVGGRLAWLLHLPSRILLEWLVAVAGVASRLPLAPVGVVPVVVAVLLVWVAVRPGGRHRRLAAAAAAAALLVPSMALAVAGPGELVGDQPTLGLHLWRSGGTTVAALDGGDPPRVLSGLRNRNVRRIDLLVVTRRGPRVLAPLAAILDRHDVVTLAGPGRLDVAGLRPFSPGTSIRAGPFSVALGHNGAMTVGRER